MSKEIGAHVVAATGLHRAEHYDPAILGRVIDGLVREFVADLTEGTQPADLPDEPRTGPRAGLIKVAGAFHTIDSHARLTMTAAAVAHEETGAPIAVHLELGTAALETAELLCGQLDVPPDRVILGHLNRNPDVRIQREIAETGVFLGFDGPSRANHASDWRLFDGLEALVEAGHGGQILLGGDTTTAAAPGTSRARPTCSRLWRHGWPSCSAATSSRPCWWRTPPGRSPPAGSSELSQRRPKPSWPPLPPRPRRRR